jgi:DNA polymerase III alpha subunit (gram-positive type)
MATYINCTETAKLIRKALKENFPGTKFSVKKSAGGSSVYVRWTDGPAETKVSKVVKFFEGATFDCTVDLKSYVSVEIDGEEVQFGADYVICQREMTRAFVEAIMRQYNKAHGYDCGVKICGTEEHAYIEYNYLKDSHIHWINELLHNTDAKDAERVYEAEEERKAQERAEWEVGAAERERQAKEQAAKEEKKRQEREARERKASEERRQREEKERQSRQQQQERDAFKAAQRMVLSSKYSALIHLGLSASASKSDVLSAFRKKVHEMSDGKGGYTGDMDFLVQVKEKALQ